MKRGKPEEEQPKREPSLWISVLKAVIPLFAAVLSAAFVLLCVVYGRMHPSLTIELSEMTPEAKAFLRLDTADAAYVFEPEERYQKAGDYRLKIHTGVINAPVTLHVRDTVAPTADGTETVVPVNTAPTPDKLVRNIRDQSIVRVSFETAPAYGTVGDYDAVVLLEDESGNQTRVPVTVKVRLTRDEIVCEAGDSAPQAEAFLIGSYKDVELQPITESMMTEPGEYPIRITADGFSGEPRLIVRDTVAPTGKGVTRIAAPEDEILPDMLVSDVEDKTAVQTEFVTPPDPDCLEPQTVEVKLVDRGGNETIVESTVLFTNIAPVTIEAHSTPLQVSELFDGETATGAALLEPFTPNEQGQHVVPVLIDGKENLAIVEVQDTTPPVITVTKTNGFTNTPLDAQAFASAEDVTETALSFAEEPDWSAEEQDVTIVALDAGGNRSEQSFTLKLKPDTEPPILYGVKNRYCYVDEPVSYFAEVSAVDNCDGEIQVEVDSSQVNESRRGSYRVTYWATDRAGNTTTKTVTFRFVRTKVDEDEAQEIAEEYIAKILTDDMTLAEQIEAIYDYVHTHVRYVPRSNKQDWRAEAVRGLTTGKGDCFTSYAAARLLLEQTDAQILSVQRYRVNTHHYWMLVNIGTGWYHYDACNVGAARHRCFMWTNAQKDAVSRDYWRFNEALYPPVATEPFNGGN